MRSASLLVALAAVIVSATGLVGGCGSNVAGTGGAGGQSGTTSTTTGTTTASSSSSGTMASSSSSGTMASSSSSGTMATSSSSSGTMASSSSSGTMTTTSSSSSSSGLPDGGPTCPSLGDPCTACLSTSCASQYCSCYGNLACDQLSQCTAGCAAGDTTCLQTCLTAHADGISPAYLLSSCGNQACATVCPSNGVMLNACQTCLFTQCDTEMDTCVADPECVPLLACWTGCAGNAACIQQCSTTYSAGVDDGDAVAVCSGASCQAACP